MDISMDSVQKLVEKSVQQWKDKQGGEEGIKQYVFGLLDKKRDEIIPKLLGFDARWGKWEVDHCNGRTQHSIVGNFIQDAAKDAIKKWLSSAKGRKLPKLTPNAVKSLKKDIEDTFQRQLKTTMNDLVIQRAENCATALVGMAVGKMEVKEEESK